MIMFTPALPGQSGISRVAAVAEKVSAKGSVWLWLGTHDNSNPQIYDAVRC